jgi:hypothetical protein
VIDDDSQQSGTELHINFSCKYSRKIATIGAFSPHVLPQRVAFYAKRFAKSQSPKICKLTLGGFTLHKKDKRNDRPPISHR